MTDFAEIENTTEMLTHIGRHTYVAARTTLAISFGDTFSSFRLLVDDIL